jgi:hypothetical protein
MARCVNSPRQTKEEAMRYLVLAIVALFMIMEYVPAANALVLFSRNCLHGHELARIIQPIDPLVAQAGVLA